MASQLEHAVNDLLQRAGDDPDKLQGVIDLLDEATHEVQVKLEQVRRVFFEQRVVEEVNKAWAQVDREYRGNDVVYCTPELYPRATHEYPGYVSVRLTRRLDANLGQDLALFGGPEDGVPGILYVCTVEGQPMEVDGNAASDVIDVAADYRQDPAHVAWAIVHHFRARGF